MTVPVMKAIMRAKCLHKTCWEHIDLEHYMPLWKCKNLEQAQINKSCSYSSIIRIQGKSFGESLKSHTLTGTHWQYQVWPTFAFQTALSLWGKDSARCWKHSSNPVPGDWGHVHQHFHLISFQFHTNRFIFFWKSIHTEMAVLDHEKCIL